MKKLLIVLALPLFLAGCNAAKSPEDTAACKESCKQEMKSDFTTKEKCKNAGEQFAKEYAARELITDPDGVVNHEYGYNSKNNTCILYLEDFKFVSIGASRHRIYDTLTGKLVLEWIETLPEDNISEEDRAKAFDQLKIDRKNFLDRKNSIFKS